MDPVAEGFDRYIIGKHIPADESCITTWNEVGDSDFGPRIRTIFEPGDILCTTRGPKLKVARVDFRGLGAHTNFVLRTKDESILLQSYMEAIVHSESFQQHLVNNFRGSVNLFVNWSDAAKYQFPLPPLEEQRRIVEVLQAANSSYEKLIKLFTTSRVLWLSTLASLPTDRRLRVVSVGELLTDIVPGRSVSGGNAPLHEFEFAVLKVSAVDPLGFHPNESKVLDDPSAFRPDFCVRKGDLLMTRANTPSLVGESCIVDKDYPNLMLCDKTLRLVPARHVNKRLLWHLLQSQELRQQITSVSTGTGGAMKNISQQKIRALKILYPESTDVAHELCDTLDECFGAIRHSAIRLRSQMSLMKLLLNSSIRGNCQ